MLDPLRGLGSAIQDALPTYLNARPARLFDAIAMLPGMRLADKTELFALTGDHPTEAASSAIGQADSCWVVESPTWGAPVAMFGCREMSPRIGQPWLILSENALNHRKALLRVGRLVIQGWHRRWPLLGNWSWCAQGAHHRLLRHLGFRFINIRQIGPLGSLAFEHVRIDEWPL